MTLWRITIRAISYISSSRKPFCWYVATISDSEKDAYKLIKQHHSPQWWEEHIVQEIEQVGDLVEIEGLKENMFVPGD